MNVRSVLRAVDELLSSEKKYTMLHKADGWFGACEPNSMFARQWSLDGAIHKVIEQQFDQGSLRDRIGLQASVQIHLVQILAKDDPPRDYQSFSTTASFAEVKDLLRRAIG